MTRKRKGTALRKEEMTGREAAVGKERAAGREEEDGKARVTEAGRVDGAIRDRLERPVTREMERAAKVRARLRRIRTALEDKETGTVETGSKEETGTEIGSGSERESGT